MKPMSAVTIKGKVSAILLLDDAPDYLYFDMQIVWLQGYAGNCV